MPGCSMARVMNVFEMLGVGIGEASLPFHHGAWRETPSMLSQTRFASTPIMVRKVSISLPKGVVSLAV